MNAIASAILELDRGIYDKALNIVKSTIRRIESLEKMDEETFKFECERSLSALSELAGQIQRNKPVSEVERLARQLRRPSWRRNSSARPRCGTGFAN